jgi:hypothetical protein
MNFPSESLLVLLRFAKGETPLSPAVVEAGLEVLKYAWVLITQSGSMPFSSGPEDVVDCIEQALSEHTEVKGFTPAIWVTIGLWVLEKVLQKLAK